MLFLLSGASASGKKTVSRLVADKGSKLVWHLESELPATTRQERMSNMERWIDRAIDYEREGRDLLLPAISAGRSACVSPCH